MAKSTSITEEEVIERVLNRIDDIGLKHVQQGFSERNFALGVLNYFLIIYVFGHFPQHFWLLGLVELLFLLPKRIHDNWTSKPLNTVLYYLDYCWMMNVLGIILLVATLSGWTIHQTEGFRYQSFLTFYGVACGPLLGAAIALPFVAVVFHDFKVMTGTFIHVLPTAIVYTAKWHTEEIRQAYPRIVDLTFLDHIKFLPEEKFFILPGTYLGTVAGNTLALYLVWFIPYVTWMVLIGINLPKRNRRAKDGSLIAPKYDTVFHSLVRSGLCTTMGKVLWGRPTGVSQKEMENDDYELRDFSVYMAMHALGIYLSVFFLAYPCYRSQKVHAAALILLTVLVVARGAKRYTYYVTSMYGKLIRRDFAAELSVKKQN